MRSLVLIIVAIMAVLCPAVSQQVSTVEKITNFPSKVIDKINSKASQLEDKLVSRTQKYLQRLAKRETRLKKKLEKIDSAAAQNLFSNTEAEYKRLSNMLNDSLSHTMLSRVQYIPNIDSLKTSLSFLELNSNLVAASPAKIKAALANVQQLQSQLQSTEQVKEFIRQRKLQIKEALSKYTKLPNSLSKDLGRFNKEAYYYSQQIREYKEILNDPDKLEQKALGLLSKLPAFQQFMKEHSALAALFPMPDNYGTPQSLAGLQTRNQMQQMIQTQLTAAGPNAQQVVQQNIQQAQAQLNQLKDKLNKFGGGSSDMDVPDFKPNEQRTKSFWKRLEYGTNLQSVKSSFFFPTTTDIGLSIAYKLSDKNSIGLGASYKMGWGKDIRHINITHEGIGLRSFVDVKLKGSFYASGGFEYNYQQPFRSLTQIDEADEWQQSGLVGISKIVSLKSKLFKKTKIQLLWDVLSYQQVPKTQAIKFRVGYNF